MQSSTFCYKKGLVDIVSESLLKIHNSFKALLFLWIVGTTLGVFL